MEEERTGNSGTKDRVQWNRATEKGDIGTVERDYHWRNEDERQDTGDGRQGKETLDRGHRTDDKEQRRETGDGIRGLRNG
jgi:hypothetical protein